MPEFTDLTFQIFSWLIPAMIIVFFVGIPLAYLLVEVIESFKARRSGLR